MHFPDFLNSRRFGQACVLTSLLFIAACSSNMPRNDLPSTGQSPIAESLRGINDYYVEKISYARLVSSSLESLFEEDPAFSLEINEITIALYHNGIQIKNIPIPENYNKLPTFWSDISFQLYSAAQKISKNLPSLSYEEFTSEFINASLLELDQFSRYAPPEEAQYIQQRRDGYVGIGIEFEIYETGIFIRQVLEDSPAEDAGLLLNDRIDKIDDIQLEGLGEEEIRVLLTGPKHSSVTLTINRTINNYSPLNITVARRKVVPNSVFFDANLLYPIIEITHFNSQTAVRLAEAIARAKDYSNHQLKGIILDLRGNPGGLLQEAIDAADLMLDSGIISQTRGRNPLSYQLFEAKPGNILGNTPLVILINGATASAAEILAAALQDQKRAVVVGSISYGKGTVQNVLQLSNQGELHLTWARYLAPNNYHIHKFGVAPNICTQNHENGIAAVLKTLRGSPDESRHHYMTMKRRQFDINGNVEDFRDSCLWEGDEYEDYDPDIEAAKTLLSNPSLYQDALALAYLGDFSLLFDR